MSIIVGIGDNEQMNNWLDRISADDLTPLSDCIDHFEQEVENARKDLDVKGHLMITIAYRLPGLMQQRYNQLQELEAVLEFLNIRYTQIKGQRHRFYMEKYDRALVSRDAEKFADADDEVLQCAMLINRIALIRNKFLGITKGLDVLHYQMTNITKLKVAGLDDATL